VRSWIFRIYDEKRFGIINQIKKFWSGSKVPLPGFHVHAKLNYGFIFSLFGGPPGSMPFSPFGRKPTMEIKTIFISTITLDAKVRWENKNDFYFFKYYSLRNEADLMFTWVHLSTLQRTL
jgi:hypothetical protein